MDLRALREDLTAVAEAAGFNAWSYVPDDPQDLPAAVVGGIQEMNRLNQHVTQIKLGISFIANAADPVDATARLDLALSTGNAESFIDMLDSVGTEDGPAWSSVRFDSAGPYTSIDLPGGGTALGVEIVLQLTA